MKRPWRTWQNPQMPARSSEPRTVSVHASWRMALAGQAGQVYAANERLAVLAVAGSVGTGQADRYSDLELDCYWLGAPTDHDRTAPVEVLGGQLEALWDYDSGEEEWSEDYQLGDLGVTVSNFLVTTAERFIDDVVLRADTDPVKHMRLAAIQRSVPLAGAELAGSWRARAGRYPDDLVVRMVGSALAPAVLAGWAARQAWSAGETAWLCTGSSSAPGMRWLAQCWRSTGSMRRIAWSNGSGTC